MEKNMKKFLALILVLAFLIVCGIMAMDFFLEKASNKALEYLAAEGASRGIEVEFATFDNVGLSGLSAVQWKGFVAVINAPKYIAFSLGEAVSLSIGEIKLDLPRLFKGVAAITAYDIGLRVKHNPASAESSGTQTEGIEQGQLIVELPLDLTNKETLAASLM
jgi:hypothetical protein